MGGTAAPAVPKTPEIPLFEINQPCCHDGRAGAAGDENQHLVTGQAEDFRGVEQRPPRFRETRLCIVTDESVRGLTDADGAAGDGGLPKLVGQHLGRGFVIDREGDTHRRVRDDGLGAGIDAFELVNVLEDENGATIGPEIPHALLQGFEVAERRAFIEQEQRPVGRRRGDASRPEHRVHGQADHHPQKPRVHREKLLGHDEEKALRARCRGL